jgi:hypothetical protein
MRPEREPAEGRDARAEGPGEWEPEAAGAAPDPSGVAPTGAPGDEPGFGPTFVGPRSATFMAARYGWTPAEQRRFAFLRWLVRTGRLRP